MERSEVYLPTKMEKFLNYISVGLIEAAVINFTEDTIKTDVRNDEQTLFVYGSMEAKTAKDLDLPEVEIKNKKKEVIGKENRIGIGVMNIPLLIKSIASLEALTDEGIYTIMTDDSLTMADSSSTYRILLCHPETISVPFSIKDQEYKIGFEIADKVNSILRGMTTIEDSTFSIEQEDKKCVVKIGTEQTNSYMEEVENTVDNDKDFRKYFNKEHIFNILSTHKGKTITFSCADMVLNIHIEDNEGTIICDYFLSPRKDLTL
jgi:hypothetical protein